MILFRSRRREEMERNQDERMDCLGLSLLQIGVFAKEQEPNHELRLDINLRSL